VIVLDAGYDKIYHWGIGEWERGLQVIHEFERGFGPHSFGFDYNNGLMFVLGEYDVAVAILLWDPVKLAFEEVKGGRHQIITHQHVLDEWTGGDILVKPSGRGNFGEYFVSLRHVNGSGYIVKYEFAWEYFRQQFVQKEVAKTPVGDWPTRITFSEDGDRVIVANEYSNSVEVLSASDLS